MEAAAISEKERFRRDARALRREFVAALDTAQRQTFELAIAERLSAFVASAGRLAAYVPMGQEVDPAACVMRFPLPTLLPFFASRDSAMEFREAGDVLEPGPFGTLQPRSAARPGRPEILLVPLVAADVHGNRIGQGKGHFDRALAALRSEATVTALGLAWDVQVFARLPADDWDEPLDAIITPARTLHR